MKPSEFLPALLGPGPYYVAALEPDGNKPPITRKIHKPEDLDVFAKKWNVERNIYFRPNTTDKPDATTLTKEDIKQGRVSFVDIDSPYKAAEAREDVIRRVKDYPVPMAFVVSTGGGYQCFVKLDDYVSGDEIERMNDTLIADLHGDDHVWTREHLMRMPGTINHPNKKKREAGRTAVMAEVIYANPDATASVFDIPLAPKRPEQPEVELDFEHVPPAHIEIDRVPEHMRFLLTEGHDEHRSQGDDMSNYQFMFAAQMRRAGWAVADIFSLLMDPEYALGQYALGKDDPERTVRRAILGAIKAGAVPPADEFDNEPLEWEPPAGEKPADEEWDPESIDVWIDKYLVPLGSIDMELVPDKQWLIPDTLLMHDLTSLAGKGSVGKSLLAWHLCICVALGIGWGPFQAPKEPRRVLILSGEDDRDEVERRLAAASIAMGVERSAWAGKIVLYSSRDIDLLRLDRATGKVHVTQLYQAIEPIMRRLNIGLLAVDPMNLVSEGFGENDNDDQKTVLKYIRRLLGPESAGLVLDHTAKGGAEGSMDAVRGGGAKVNFARVVMTMNEAKLDDLRGEYLKGFRIPDKDVKSVVELHKPKNNYGPKTAGGDFFRILGYEVSSHASAPGMVYLDPKDGQSRPSATEEFDGGIDNWEHKQALLDCIARGRDGDGKRPWLAAGNTPNPEDRLDFAVQKSTGEAIEKVRMYIKDGVQSGAIVHYKWTNPETRKKVMAYGLPQAQD